MPKTRKSLVYSIIIFFSIISLFFSVTNFLPFSALMFILIIFVPLLFFKYTTHNELFLSLSIMIGYFIINTLLYYPQSFLEYAFYRRDGNVFITFAPLIILTLLKIKIDVSKVMKNFVSFATVINLILLIIYTITGKTLALDGKRIILSSMDGLYHFLFIAHNAAGGFLAMLSAMTIGVYVQAKKKRYLFYLLINLYGLYVSNSRGSIIALIIGMIIIILDKKRFFHVTIVGTIIITQITMMSWFYVNSSPNVFLQGGKVQLISEVKSLFEVTKRSYTVMDRAFAMWPKAIYLFNKSPVFGTGFGSYNDIPYNFEDNTAIVQFNKAEYYRFSDAHAHHTFLNVLGETGIIGLILLLGFIEKIRKFIINMENKDKDLKYALYLCLWVAIISSLTEHRFFTPSQMLPFTIILGLAVSNYRYEKALKNLKLKENKSDENCIST